MRHQTPPSDTPPDKTRDRNQIWEHPFWHLLQVSGTDATPPCRTTGCSYAPVAALSAVSSVSQGCRSYTPPPRKGSVAPHSAQPCRVSRVVCSERNPVALQRVEQLHLRVSRYTLTLSASDGANVGGFVCVSPVWDVTSSRAFCLPQPLNSFPLELHEDGRSLHSLPMLELNFIDFLAPML